MARYTVKYKTNFGTYDDIYDNLDEALSEFLSLHSEGNKVQLTAEVPTTEKDEWDF